MNESELSRLITMVAGEVHQSVGGPGLDEKIYRDALSYELEQRGLKVERRIVPAGKYEGVRISRPEPVDMVVDDQVVVECRAAGVYKPVWEAEALTHLRLTGLRLALVINFGDAQLRNAVRRVVNQEAG